MRTQLARIACRNCLVLSSPHTALSQPRRWTRFIRPAAVGLTRILLGKQAVHQARTLGLRSVDDGAYPHTLITLEVLEDRLGKCLIVAHVRHDSLVVETRA